MVWFNSTLMGPSSVKVPRSRLGLPFRKTAGVITAPMRARSADVIDVFVYVVVLNLAIEYVPSVISEGFTLSLLTAVLLKVALEVVILVKERIVDKLRAATRRRGKLLSRRRCGRSRRAASSSSWSSSTSSSVMR